MEYVSGCGLNGVSVMNQGEKESDDIYDRREKVESSAIEERPCSNY